MIETRKSAIRVWSAGCARGEEVYSFKIIWDRLKEKYPHQVPLAITAIDVNPDSIEKAREGGIQQKQFKGGTPRNSAALF
jgi:chemotaxis protein methyltransferase CheR